MLAVSGERADPVSLRERRTVRKGVEEGRALAAPCDSCIHLQPHSLTLASNTGATYHAACHYKLRGGYNVSHVP